MTTQTMTPQTTEFHVIAAEDRKRIRCDDCGRRAAIVQHARWNTGNAKGVSFYPFCARCAKRRGINPTRRLRNRHGA